MKDTKRITYGRTSVYNLNYHLIWGTKYRNKVLKGHVEEVLKQSLYDIASKYGFTIAHMEIGKDDHRECQECCVKRETGPLSIK